MHHRFQKYTMYGSVLLNEAWNNPSWAACHLLGMIDHKILLQFHNQKVRELYQDGHCQSSVLEFITHELGSDISVVQREYEQVKKEWNIDASSRSIPVGRDASEELQFLLFALVLLMKPKNILEFGVARGASSRALLSGLEIIGSGRLVSIDFPF
jgi:hypothetical protein